MAALFGKMLARFKGCLTGAVVGDCIGSEFEALWAQSVELDQIKCIILEINKVYKQKTTPYLNPEEGIVEQDAADCKLRKWEYTDDTAMARSVAASLVQEKGLNPRNMSCRFAEEFFKEPDRGYGRSVTTVFEKLADTKYLDPYGPASEQFDGKGSFGNGGAMRIAPAALFNYAQNDYRKLQELTKDITRITHTHPQAIQGAVLQAWAVDLALRIENPSQVNVDQFVDTLHDRMANFEKDSQMAKLELEDDKNPYCCKLEKIKSFLKQSNPPIGKEVHEEIGADIAALDSVPAAIYAFLRTTLPDPELKEMNPLERTIVYAISFGGDTDTVATMAGAIAGACYGIEQVPLSWQSCCEGVDQAIKDAQELYAINFPGEETTCK